MDVEVVLGSLHLIFELNALGLRRIEENMNKILNYIPLPLWI